MSPPNNTVARQPLSPGQNASLDNWLKYLESIHPTEIELGLERALVVYRRLFRRNPNARIITVGGTNGKGSTVAALEGLLLAAGRSTGAYTSPHLERYNERVRIDGVDVSDEVMVRAFEAVESARGSTSLTYFEFGTLAAFVVFRDAGVDDWLLEVGLGGRLDAVNILDAELSIITSVDLDHQAFLGTDVEAIGFEKAGILRPDRTAIFADYDPPRSVLQQARAQNIRLLRPGDGYQLVDGAQNTAETVLQIADDHASIRLPRSGLPVNSLAAAVVAMRSLQPEFSVQRIASVLPNLALPGRFETLQSNPLVIADVGHNPHAARWLATRIRSVRQPGQQVLAVYGALNDKDVSGVVSAMASEVDRWFLAGLNVPRGLDGVALTARIESVIAAGDRMAFPSVNEALGAAMGQASDDDLVLVFGSFFTVANARKALR